MVASRYGVVASGSNVSGNSREARMTNPNIEDLQNCTNRELSGAALDCLRELKHRGNKSLNSAIETVSSFHDNLVKLQDMANELDAEQSDYELDYEDKLALDD